MNAWPALALTTSAIRCPSCDESPSTVFRTRDEIAAELAMRDAFFARLLDGEHARDVTDVLMGTPADILRCDACDILVRDDPPDDDAFRNDRYERDVLDSLHAVHAAAFREKLVYRTLLPAGARVIEVGSYVGGFLVAAREWDWGITGVDIGRDASRFTRGLGFDVRAHPFEECGFKSESFEAVFIWNCFEQLPAPRVALTEAFRILRTRGLLVLRVPDADFYAHCRDLAALAHNGLLGWPHRFGFGIDALRHLVAEHGFTLQLARRAAAIRPLRHAVKPFGWIEAGFRKE